MPGDTRSRPPFQPRFTLGLFYLFVFFFLYCILLVSPQLYEAARSVPPGPEQEEVTKLWEQCVQIVAEIISDGIERGSFVRCDPWEVANLLWTIANGLIQTETSATRRQLRRAPLVRAFDDAVEVVLRGLAVSPVRLS